MTEKKKKNMGGKHCGPEQHKSLSLISLTHRLKLSHMDHLSARAAGKCSPAVNLSGESGYGETAPKLYHMTTPDDTQNDC